MKILIVDDELVSREKLRKIMDTFGQCVVVENGADALQVAASQNPPDLILLDIIMPEIDGYEVCKRLKANRRTSNIPVIFISAKSEEDDEAQGLELGAVDYITKPFTPSIVKARVRTHLELKKHRNHLKELVSERTVELEKAYKELRSTQAQLIQAGKLSSIGELASGVAHELNQPLTVIRVNAQLIQRNLRKSELNVETLSEQIEPLNRNAKRMMNIINHLQTFSRQSQRTFSPVDINKIIEDSFLMVGEQLRIRNIDVVRNLKSDLPMVNGDANQLEQVFLNLITNARDAITSNVECGMRNADLIKNNKTHSEFKGKLEIITRTGELENQESTIKNRQSKDFIEILFRDNGAGIPADKVDKIFDPFFTTKEAGKGTGLGLSISYGIIKDHGGEIYVADTGTEGTTFRIRLPIEY